MALKRILIVALALGVAPGMGCKKKSNTTEQTQSPAGTGDQNTSAPANPNQPNPTNAQSGSAMGSVGADNAAGTGSAGSAMGGAGAAPSDAGTQDAK